ncbi:MAG: CRISPR-associated helicase Cas3' [Eubacteriaceae bacterium]|nr:CRISPR-associated helicase Cas3' [Eubacteriaceae bacterium]
MNKNVHSEDLIAHLRKNENGKTEIQSVDEHCRGVAKLASEFAIDELKDVVYIMGLLHDEGKKREAFQKYINGLGGKTEHSIYGAKIAKEVYKGKAVNWLMAYAIAGHHGGLPDAGVKSGRKGTLIERLNNCNDIDDVLDDYKEDRLTINFKRYWKEDLLKLNQPKLMIDKFAFLTRFCYSCLVDADWIDTERFCNPNIQRKTLKSDFDACLKKLDHNLSNLSSKSETPLQKARSAIQNQVYDKVNENFEIGLMHMPTGAGKTLCSMKFALMRALKYKKKRIIYVIPYNSIIDQTADVFESVFGSDIQLLRHQSSFDYDSVKENNNTEIDEDYRNTAKLALENWDADIIITTAVQFFESMYGNTRRQLRKIHNIKDSILIFDEAHLMPLEYLQPCLEAIAFSCRYLNSEALMLTATMPDYQKMFNKLTLPDLNIIDLVEDKSSFDVFVKCQYQFAGKIKNDDLLSDACAQPSSLVVVNTRDLAKSLYESCAAQTKYHLSTYMTGRDRQATIKKIRKQLHQLEKDFPDGNVPKDRRIIVFSTSLVEAGVDFDFHAVYRELSGLDSIIQCGGRCNREGKRQNAKVTVFQISDDPKFSFKSLAFKASVAENYLNQNINESGVFRDYYEKILNSEDNYVEEKTMYATEMFASYASEDFIRKRKPVKIENKIPFKTYAQAFKFIKDSGVDIVIPQDDFSYELLEQLQYKDSPLSAIRKLQPYICSVYPNQFEVLYEQGVLVNYGENFGENIWALKNMEYYDSNTGIQFEGKDYIL